jgi:transcription elongation factor Elf1
MTARKPLSESKRPRRRAGQVIANFLGCPFCRPPIMSDSTLRVIAYRWRSVRVECGECGGRFSFTPLQVAEATAKLPRDGPDGRPRFHAFIAHEIAGGFIAGQLRDLGWTPERIREELAKHGISDTEDDG